MSSEKKKKNYRLIHGDSKVPKMVKAKNRTKRRILTELLIKFTVKRTSRPSGSRRDKHMEI